MYFFGLSIPISEPQTIPLHTCSSDTGTRPVQAVVAPLLRALRHSRQSHIKGSLCVDPVSNVPVPACIQRKTDDCAHHPQLRLEHGRHPEDHLIGRFKESPLDRGLRQPTQPYADYRQPALDPAQIGRSTETEQCY